MGGTKTASQCVAGLPYASYEPEAAFKHISDENASNPMSTGAFLSFMYQRLSKCIDDGIAHIDIELHGELGA